MLKPIPDGKIYNFFIDDNVFFFDDILRHRFSSIFDSFYLAGLKQAHQRFGTRFTLNTFYHNWHHPEFDLSPKVGIIVKSTRRDSGFSTNGPFSTTKSFWQPGTRGLRGLSP